MYGLNPSFTQTLAQQNEEKYSFIQGISLDFSCYNFVSFNHFLNKMSLWNPICLRWQQSQKKLL